MFMKLFFVITHLQETENQLFLLPEETKRRSTKSVNLTMVHKNLTHGLVALILLFSFCNAQKKSKYSKESNAKMSSTTSTWTSKQDIAQKLEAKSPFRMHKFNMFWENVKTASHLSEDQKVQLFVDLQKHDKEEIELKHLKVARRVHGGLPGPSNSPCQAIYSISIFHSVFLGRRWGR